MPTLQHTAPNTAMPTLQHNAPSTTMPTLKHNFSPENRAVQEIITKNEAQPERPQIIEHNMAHMRLDMHAGKLSKKMGGVTILNTYCFLPAKTLRLIILPDG